MTDIVAVCVIYEVFIRPLTGKGVLYFFAVPLFLSGLTYSLMFLAKTHELYFVWRLLMFIILLFVTYWMALQEPLRDIRSGIMILRNQDSKVE